MEHSSWNFHGNSKDRIVVVCTLMRAGFIFSGGVRVGEDKRYTSSIVGRDQVYRGDYVVRESSKVRNQLYLVEE